MSKSVKHSGGSKARRKAKVSSAKSRKSAARGNSRNIKVEQILTDGKCRVRTPRKKSQVKVKCSEEGAARVNVKAKRGAKKPNAGIKKDTAFGDFRVLRADRMLGSGLATPSDEAKTQNPEPISAPSVAPASIVIDVNEAPKELPQIIIHRSGLLTNKSSLATAPEPTVMKKKPEIIISISDTKAKKQSGAEAKRPAKKVQVTDAKQASKVRKLPVVDMGGSDNKAQKALDADGRKPQNRSRKLAVVDSEQPDEARKSLIANDKQLNGTQKSPVVDDKQLNGVQKSPVVDDRRTNDGAQQAPAVAFRQPIDMTRVHARMERRLYRQESVTTSRPTARELKQRAIDQALVTASHEKPSKRSARSQGRVRFGFRRVILALGCTAAIVFAIVYFTNLNSPNIALKVAAMQTGIEASYPAYVPRDFNLSDITSEDGKVTLNFKNSTSGAAYSIIEERSAWDNTALVENYVKETYGNDYTEIREQGLTLYVSGSNASWVNGGVVYKLKTALGSLTKKQIKAIAVSL